MNTISHRVYQTGEGERESDRPRTSENQARVIKNLHYSWHIKVLSNWTGI